MFPILVSSLSAGMLIDILLLLICLLVSYFYESRPVLYTSKVMFPITSSAMVVVGMMDGDNLKL